MSAAQCQKHAGYRGRQARPRASHPDGREICSQLREPEFHPLSPAARHRRHLVPASAARTAPTAGVSEILPSTKGKAMKDEEVRELLYQALETELGGVQVYQTAIRCAVNDDLKKEWQKYLEQTQNHVRVVENLFGEMDLDPEAETPGRLIVRHIGESLVKAMELALDGGKPETAEIVATECVVLAETKDHLNWELIGELGKKVNGDKASAFKEAHEEVEEEEDEHLYHTTGWSRELWIQALGMPAVLPPPEEEKDVKTAIGAARAKPARGRMKKAS